MIYELNGIGYCGAVDSILIGGDYCRFKFYLGCVDIKIENAFFLILVHSLIVLYIQCQLVREEFYIFIGFWLGK